jgi:hypothetical protein
MMIHSHMDLGPLATSDEWVLNVTGEDKERVDISQSGDEWKDIALFCKQIEAELAESVARRMKPKINEFVGSYENATGLRCTIDLPLFSGLAAVKNIQVDLPIEALDTIKFLELHPLLKYPFDSVTFKFKGDRKTALKSLGTRSVYEFVFETNMTRDLPSECPRPRVRKAADALRTIHDQIDKSKE